MKPVDLYLRYRDPARKQPDVYRQVRAWDAGLLLANEQDAQAKEKPKDFRVVTAVSREEYLEATQRKEKTVA